MKRMMVGAAAFALVCAGLVPALAQTTQFMVAGAPVTVGAQQANSGKGYPSTTTRTCRHRTA